MKTFLFLLPILVLTSEAFAQNDISSETFQLSFSTKKDGGQFVFNGKSHYFSIDIIADSISTSDNPNFIIADNHIVQVSTIPLPPIKPDLQNLTTMQQKVALEAYVQYEMDYFKNQLNLNIGDLKKEWVTINDRMWLIWSFDTPEQKQISEVTMKTKSQIYASSICYNQVLDLNTPVMPEHNFKKSKALINKMMASLKLVSK